MARFTIVGETFELDGVAEQEARSLVEAFDRDVKELCARKWPHTPGVLDEPGVMDAIEERRIRLLNDFRGIARRVGDGE